MADALRKHLLELLEGKHAHTDFEAAVAGFPVKRAGEKPAGAPHSAGVPALATAATSTTQSAAAAIKRIPHPPRADADGGEYGIKYAVRMSRSSKTCMPG